MIQTSQGEELDEQTAQASRPKRTGSLALFFRKVYHLSHLRLDALCQALQVYDEDIKRKIWTTFEHTLTEHTNLMKDRHLDQLLMCSLYIVCKVVGQNKNFTDIMKQYRNQPQAASHVYRSVLLRPKSAAATTDEGKSPDDEEKSKNNPPPTPTRLAASSTIVDGEERGDLIKFYNMVFMEQLQEFSLKFKRSRVADAPPLSPLPPKLRAHPQSPCRRVSENHSVYIRPLKSTPNEVVTYNPHSPHKPLSYSFSRSPAKDLAAINALMTTEKERKAGVGKRLLTDDVVTTADGTALLLDGSATTYVIQEQQEQPPTKIQVIGTMPMTADATAAAAGGTVNAKLGIVLGDRSAQAD